MYRTSKKIISPTENLIMPRIMKSPAKNKKKFFPIFSKCLNIQQEARNPEPGHTQGNFRNSVIGKGAALCKILGFCKVAQIIRRMPQTLDYHNKQSFHYSFIMAKVCEFLFLKF